jgi:hypothetical protein
MNSREARNILELHRPGGPHAPDPRLAEALALAERDPELARWFAGQRRFDETISAAFKSIPVPSGLKADILGRRGMTSLESDRTRTTTPPSRGPSVKPGIPRTWLPALLPLPRRPAARLALAACLALCAGLAALFLTRSPAPFSDYRHALVAQAWEGGDRLEFESSSFDEVRQWLAQQDTPADFALPEPLQSWRVRGCSIVECQNRRASMVCLSDGARHVHLFVTEHRGLAALPEPGVPDFEKCGAWRTAAWRQGERAYILSGMRYHVFVQKFRKSGRWALTG